jgi:drug/metabolite transporter (DMT)-like permease
LGGNNIVVKTTVDELSPLAYVVGRFLIVMLLVWGWIAWRRVPWRIAAWDLPLLILVGVAGFGFFNAMFTVGMERTSAFSVALLLSLGPVFTLVLARLAGIERQTVAQWLAVALAAAGVLIFVGDKLSAQGPTSATMGDVMALLAALAFAVYSLAVRPLTNRYSATVTTAWAVTIGLAAIAPWGVSASLETSWRQLSPAVWGALIYSSALAMLLGYTFWAFAIARTTVARTVPYLFLVPVGTGIIAAIALGETFGPLKLAGAALVLIGTALVRLLGGSITSQPEPDPAVADATGIVVANTDGAMLAGQRGPDAEGAERGRNNELRAAV